VVVCAKWVVRMKVMEADVARKRIGLSMKLDAAPARPTGDRNDAVRGIREAGLILIGLGRKR
jgi:protein Tex